MAREGAPASRFIPRTTVLGKPEACELDARGASYASQWESVNAMEKNMNGAVKK